MKKFANNQGITLTALVITIILLIILAAVGISAGRNSIETARLTAYGTELITMQNKVNELEQKYKQGDSNALQLGRELQNNPQETKAFLGANESNKADYRYYNNDTLVSLGLKNFNQEFLVDVKHRKVISLYGIEYKGNMIWTPEQLEDGTYDVNFTGIASLVTFDLGISDNKLLVKNIRHTGNVKNASIYYGQGETEQTVSWKTATTNTPETSCKIDLYDDGIWYVKVEDSAGNSTIKNANVQTATFDANGGIAETTYKKVIAGQEYGELPTPTREGYTFLGWNGKNKFCEEKYLKLEDFTFNKGSYQWAEIILKPNKTYKASVKRYNNFDGKLNYLLLAKEKSPGSNGKWSAIAHVSAPNVIQDQYTLDSNGILYIGHYLTMTQEDLDTIWANTDVQLEEGTTATEYEPYFLTSTTTVTQNKTHTLTAQWQKNE